MEVLICLPRRQAKVILPLQLEWEVVEEGQLAVVLAAAVVVLMAAALTDQVHRHRRWRTYVLHSQGDVVEEEEDADDSSLGEGGR